MSEKRTEIGELGEFGLIERISAPFTNQQSSTIHGIGDDAAVIDSGDHYTVVSTDMLIEGVHFDLAYMPLAHLGYKAVAVNVSDISAMNALPTQVTVSIGLSNRFSVEAVEVLYEGIRSACTAFGVDLIGGDTTSSPSGLVISVTAIGTVAKDAVAYRSGANVHDIICASGDLGGAYVGLQILEREKQVFMANPEMQPELDKYDYVVKRQLKTEARTDIVHELKDLGIQPTSMIDVSDGLASDLFHVCKQSKVGVRIYEDKLPIATPTYDTAVELNLDPITCVLNGGEDYELLFTIPEADADKVKNHPDITMIGFVQSAEDGKLLITKGGTPITLKAQGWVHF
ncbi:MAG: thiamine-phosphate kinase [Cyclobacteriaceae bacterium]